MPKTTYPRVLVCGGRDYNDRRYVFSEMDFTMREYGMTTLIEGGAKGADSLAREWAKERGLTIETYEADWDTYGKQAGYFRNRRMLVEGKPDLVIAFPGGKGTKMMVNIAKNANVPVWVF